MSSHEAFLLFIRSQSPSALPRYGVQVSGAVTSVPPGGAIGSRYPWPGRRRAVEAASSFCRAILIGKPSGQGGGRGSVNPCIVWIVALDQQASPQTSPFGGP